MEIDGAVRDAFSGVTIEQETDRAAVGGASVTAAAAAASPAPSTTAATETFPELDEAGLAELGKTRPNALAALLAAAAAADAAAWRAAQARLQTLKLRRSRLTGQLADARGLLDAAAREAGKRQGLGVGAAVPLPAPTRSTAPSMPSRTGASSPRPVSIVLVAGFESFNVSLYASAAARVAAAAPHVSVSVFSDRDAAARSPALAATLAGADAFFGSLLFDYDAVEWLRSKLAGVPVVLAFESALELMSETRLGSFTMAGGGAGCSPCGACALVAACRTHVHMHTYPATHLPALRPPTHTHRNPSRRPPWPPACC